MSQNAELTIYIGLDGTTPHLYTSESATEPLPSHELVLNEDVACTFKFLLKSSVNDVFASSPSYLQWVGDPPNVSNQSRTDRQVTFTVTNGNSGSGEQSYSFKLFLGTNGEVTILKKGSIPVDPTIVEKPPG